LKKILLVFALLIGGFDVAHAASAPANVRTRASTGVQSAQSGRRTTATTPTVVSRGNQSLSQRTSVQQRGNAASTSVSRSRAAKTQSVVNTGTKVATAAQNTVVDEECLNKFNGCMDSFCMLDNANGGRCMCSNRNAELDAILAEIQKLDEKSYDMATAGVEKINMGENADLIIAQTDEITKKIAGENTKSKRNLLDLSDWNATSVEFDDMTDIFAATENDITTQTGDKLFRASAELCKAQISECSSQFAMLESMYKTRVRSDCTAYENSLKQQRTQSAQKLAAAQNALREAALEQYRSANKYDLGQCTSHFKQCMQTTAGCGEDFSNCVTYDYTHTKLKGKNAKLTKIEGALTTIEISASTYDALDSKRPLCIDVTKNCVAVRDQVWDTFLREAAPELKSAELIAESNVRYSCISNISKCFQKACKDNIDPNDPEGSYDLCLTRPETFRSLCKVDIEPCEAMDKSIMESVFARLASMRVDSCTNAFKSCLQSEDRCGKDYTQCIGLDTDTIVRMCPSDKLAACRYQDKSRSVKTEDEIYAELENIATGIFLSIDNNLLSECQRVADAAMIKVCGTTEDCNDLVIDDDAGTRSFQYQVCQYNGFKNGANTQNMSQGTSSANGVNGFSPNWTGQCFDSLAGIPGDLIQPEPYGWAGKLSGLVYWGEISYNPETSKFTTYDEYIAAVEQATQTSLDSEQKEIIRDRVFNTEIVAMANAVESAIKAIESDTKVQFCITGRKFQGMRDQSGLKYIGKDDGSTARFPNLTSQMRQIIANSALQNAKKNYMKKYDEEMERMMRDQVTAAQRIDAANATQQAAQTCIDWAETSVLPQTKTPKASNVGRWIAVGVLAVVAVVASTFTFGAVASYGAAAGLAATAPSVDNNTPAIGKRELNQWNYKENVTTVFNYQTGECTKTTVTQNCKKTKKNVCKTWNDPVESVTSIQLLNKSED
jgi:hypothetical protein